MAKAAETTMDYAEHEKTFGLFVKLVKFSMAGLASGSVALYSFIIAHNFWAGLFFLIIAVPLGLWASGFVRARR